MDMEHQETGAGELETHPASPAGDGVVSKAYDDFGSSMHVCAAVARMEVRPCETAGTKVDTTGGTRKETKRKWKYTANFLASTTTYPKLVMWAYATWYVVVISLIPHPTKKPFLDALVIMFLIGFVLNANAYASFRATAERLARPAPGEEVNKPSASVPRYLRCNSASALRLFFIPYMVSSYSASAGASVEGTFVSVFPADPYIWAPAVGASVAVPLCLTVARRLVEVKAERVAQQERRHESLAEEEKDSTIDMEL